MAHDLVLSVIGWQDGCRVGAQEGANMAATEVPKVLESPVRYEPPRLDEMGDVVDLTRGTAADDTADMKTAKYW
jgi:hypothetical protein